MQNNNQSRTQGESGNKSQPKSSAAGEKSSESKSIGSVIGESLAKDAQEKVDEVMERVNGYFKTAKEYVSENPKETVAVGVAIAVAAWALLYTKPGRQVFEKGSAIFVPQITAWAKQTFAGESSSKQTKH